VSERGERTSDVHKGAAAVVEPSHGSALIRTLTGVTRVEHEGGSGDGGTLRSSLV
jgi:hypothetical protein